MSKGKLNTFRIDFKSEEDDQTYNGQFTSRKLSIMDHSKVQRRKNELNGGMFCVLDGDNNPTGQGMDADTEFFNYMIATLEISLVQRPEWWNLDEISDKDLILQVFKEVMSFENSFRRRKREALEKAELSGSHERVGAEESKDSVTSNNPTPVVGKEVQAALDA